MLFEARRHGSERGSIDYPLLHVHLLAEQPSAGSVSPAALQSFSQFFWVYLRLPSPKQLPELLQQELVGVLGSACNGERVKAASAAMVIVAATTDLIVDISLLQM